MQQTQENRKKILEEKHDTVKELLRKYSVYSIVFLIVGIVLFFIIPLAVYIITKTGIIHNKKIFILIPVTMLYGLVLMLMSTVIRSKSYYSTELQEIQNELDLLSISNSSIEERSEKLFKHHHFELKRYYDENLKQSSWIFIVGIVCIFVGFIIIGITMYFLLTNNSNQVTNKIIIASMGAIGALLSNFIAAIYLKMHSETVKSLTEFHNRFVNTHHFYFGNFLISKIKNQRKREDTLAQLALNINSDSANDTPLTLNLSSASSDGANKEKK
ncbi:hypothetical protein AB0764_10505 [Priestia megaterium]|uniref:TRADD-N-associated membrane domain-containing protein n=1 Tax=Priestia megaterium TaxID=1404 RepID=UPI003877A3BB